jgi:GNAT superfamily N-acetyltransferase
MEVREAKGYERPTVAGILDAAVLRIEGLAERLAAGDVLVAAAESIVGTIVCDPGTTGGAHIEAIAVRQRRRGQGIGTRLVRAAADRYGRLTAVFDPELRPFYEQLGFDIEPSIQGGRLRGARPE